MSTRVVMPPAAAARVAVQKPLPLGAPGVVDVHVGVDQAGQQDVVAEVFEAGTRGHFTVVRQDGRDPPVGHRDRGGPRPLGCDDAPRAQHQFSVGHPDPSLPPLTSA
ncbi:hypothetical protein M2164_002038 [Streptomyces sp. SAI-208]|nr:hypothetical protein [Streptomyces sp. SAI-208]